MSIAARSDSAADLLTDFHSIPKVFILGAFCRRSAAKGALIDLLRRQI